MAIQAKASPPADDDDDDSHTTLGGHQHHRHDGDNDGGSCASSVDLLAPSSSPQNPTEAPVVMSPATQTLDLLSQSQDENDLRYDWSQLERDARALQKEDEQQQEDRRRQSQQQDDPLEVQGEAVERQQEESTPKEQQQKSAEQQASDLRENEEEADVLVDPLDFADWYVSDIITLCESGKVGLTLIRKQSRRHDMCYAIVSKVAPDKQAGRAGVLPGDVICRVGSTDAGKEWIPHDDFHRMCISSSRPIVFRVAREPQSEITEVDSQNMRLSENVDADTDISLVEPTAGLASQCTVPEFGHRSNQGVAVLTTVPVTATEGLVSAPTPSRSTDIGASNSGHAGTMQEESNGPRVLGSTTGTSEEELVPFCRTCHGSTNPVHHPMCPKHPVFFSSGAHEKLALIRQGVQRQCPACILHYQLGKLPSKGGKVAHAQNCETLRQPLFQNVRATAAVGRLETTDAILASTEKTTKSKRTKKGKKNGAAKNSTLGFMLSDQDDVQAAARTLSSFTSDRTADYDQGRKQQTLARQTATRESRIQSRHVTPASARASKLKQVPNRSKANAANAFIMPEWVPCGDPWGAPGYEEGDVVLFSRSRGYTSPETEYPHARFASSPFSTSPFYHDTHQTPAQGAQTLVLTRDRLATKEWGFTFRRHEFGGACLVKSVEPFSPAAAAKYRGWEANDTGDSALRVHDMIVAVNGQAVGGMTTLGFEIELSVCGPEVQLAVLRYKHPEQASRQLMRRENREWDAFEETQHDCRRLDSFAFNVNSSPMKDTAGDLLPDRDISPIAFRRGDHLATDATFATGLTPIYQHQEFSERYIGGLENYSQTPIAQDVSSNRDNSVDASSSHSSDNLTDEEENGATWANDDNPWLGCVCGKTHPEPQPVFWIRCDDCGAWYNAKKECIGFSEDAAAKLSEWMCPACIGSEADREDIASRNDLLGVESKNQDIAIVTAKPSATNDLKPEHLYGLQGAKRKPELPVKAKECHQSSKRMKHGDAGAATKALAMSNVSHKELDRIKRWTDDGCFISATQPQRKSDGSFARPGGRCPAGLHWDSSRGLFAPKNSPLLKKSKYRGRSTRRLLNDKLTRDESGVVPGSSTKRQHADPEEPHDATRRSGKNNGNDSGISAKKPSRPTAVEHKSDMESRQREDGYLAPAKVPKQRPDGTFAKPPGPIPRGMVWDEAKGLWAPKLTKAKKRRPWRRRDSVPALERGSACRRDSLEESHLAQAFEGMYANSKGLNDKTPRARQVESIVSVAEPSTKDRPRSSWTQAERKADIKRRERAGGCLAPAVNPKQLSDGTFARPPGTAPRGLLWDAVRCLWVPKALATERKSQRNTISEPPAVPQDAIHTPISQTARNGDLWPVGSIVNVASRSWPGVNKEGGIGKVMDYQKDDATGEVSYSVSYLLGGRERNIPAMFVSAQKFIGRRSSERQCSSPASLSY